jgi:carbamoyl-phosphate synthase large subunit
MVNCNPETVSTDYDTSDRLYFEPLTLEDVLEIVDKEKPRGVIVQYGGQTPLKLARDLEAHGVPIIGTSPDSIDIAEDRERFQQLLHRLQLKQPPNRTARTEEDALRLAEEIGYPLVVRPSYVLGGRAMDIVHEPRDLERYMREAVKVSNDSPVLLDRFLDDAIEVDVDCLADGKRVLIGGVMEHIEQAGVHSGDSACSLPPYSLSESTIAELKQQTEQMARALQVVGLMNVQFAIQTSKDGQSSIYVLEVNPRASRTVAFVSKATGMPLAKIAALAMVGIDFERQGIGGEIVPPYFSIKEAVFPFAKFVGVDPLLGPEMRSTGEVMGVGETFGEALFKSQLGAGATLPDNGTVFLSVKDQDKAKVIAVAQLLHDMGYALVATRGTAQAIEQAGIPVKPVNKVKDGRPHVVDLLKNGDIQLVITTVSEVRSQIADSRSIRTTALAQRVTYYTTIAGGRAAIEGMKHLDHLEVTTCSQHRSLPHQDKPGPLVGVPGIGRRDRVVPYGTDQDARDRRRCPPLIAFEQELGDADAGGGADAARKHEGQPAAEPGQSSQLPVTVVIALLSAKLNVIATNVAHPWAQPKLSASDLKSSARTAMWTATPSAPTAENTIKRVGM